MGTPDKRIILIDDDPIANMISKRIIERNFAGCVIAFSNGKEAIDRIREWWQSEPPTSPVVIFLDIDMPHMNGWEFLDEFEKLPSQVLALCTVAMLTSSIDLQDIEKSKTYRTVKDFISKPLTHDKLGILNQIRHSYNP